MGVSLVDIYSEPDLLNFAEGYLFGALEERLALPHVNISHKRMPTFEEHIAFINRRPYAGWWLIVVGTSLRGTIGTCYLTQQNEIGIQINPKFQRKGYATDALAELIAMYPEGTRFLANINPANEASAALFKKFGFTLIQHTYAREA